MAVTLRVSVEEEYPRGDGCVRASDDALVQAVSGGTDTVNDVHRQRDPPHHSPDSDERFTAHVDSSCAGNFELIAQVIDLPCQLRVLHDPGLLLRVRGCANGIYYYKRLV